MQWRRFLATWTASERPLSSKKHGLLMLAFCRALGRYAAKSGRLELVGGSSELSSRAAGEGWTAQVHARLDLRNIVRQLSERNAAVLTLRAAEYEWKEIASLLGTSVAGVKNGFWREVKRIKWKSDFWGAGSDGRQ